jgi:ABC-type transport system involved in multi-copper enzyme maturation permease subunit
VKDGLRAELIKLRTTRTFVTFVCIAVGTSLLIAGLVASLTIVATDDQLVDVYSIDTSRFFILVLAIVGITGEWRHRTITSSLLAAPDRIRFLASKTIAFATAGGVLSLCIAVAVAALVSIVLVVRGLSVPTVLDLVELVGRNLYVAALLGALGVVFGAIVRNQVAGVVGVLVAIFVIEPLLVGLVPDVGRWAPFSVLPTAAGGLADDDSSELPSALAATVALLGWIVVLFGVAAVLLRRRDLD